MMTKRHMRVALAAGAAVFIVLAASVLHAQDNDTCLSCHGEKTDGIPFVSQEEFSNSIHGKNLCISCHTDVKEVPHEEKLAPVSCATCHRTETAIYSNSDHGKALSRGVTEAATCTSCHGKTHTLLSSRNPASPVNRKNIPETCGSCHADKEKMSKFRLTEKEPLDSYFHSVHGQSFKEGEISAAVCSDCHGTHDLHSASNPQSKVYRTNVPKTCGRCHENVREVYDRSTHGKAAAAGIKESPVCTSCHGEHTIHAVSDPDSTVSAGSVTKTCSECHESEKITAKFGLPTDRLKTYKDSYHGLAAQGGDLRVANCASCHGAHDILPSSDGQSSINPKNMRYTCGKCHTGAESRRIEGPIHGAGGGGIAGGKLNGQVLTKWVRLFYLALIPLIIGGMLIHNFSDYLRKTLSGGRACENCHSPEEIQASTALRLTVNERMQHIVLMITFIILAYTGFALKYPHAWWAAPFDMAGGEALRKSIHRWTALCLVSLGAYHLIYMVSTRRGRELLTDHYYPKLRDLTDPLLIMAYNLGLRKTKPKHTYPSYIEKMEYFSLIWGSIVMLVTGSLLVFNDYTLKFFPLWVSDVATVIHFYEAILACLAITVWHFYWAIFDPDVYPMNWTWLTGRMRRATVRECETKD